MKKLLMLIMLCLLASCASKQPTRYNSVEEYSNSNATTEIGHWESPAYKKQEKDENAEAAGKALSWTFRTLTSPSLIP